MAVETSMTVQEAAKVAAEHFGCPDSDAYVLTFYGQEFRAPRDSTRFALGGSEPFRRDARCARPSSLSHDLAPGSAHDRSRLFDAFVEPD